MVWILHLPLKNYETCPSPRKKHDLHLETNLQKSAGYSFAHMHCQLRFVAHTSHDDPNYITQSGRIHVVSTSDINVCQFRFSN